LTTTFEPCPRLAETKHRWMHFTGRWRGIIFVVSMVLPGPA
jgi:hypothetical protein